MILHRYVMTGLLLIMAPACVYGQDKQTVGWIEKALIYPGGVPFDAKLDTGAATSSINAVDIEKFDQDGQEWVRFCAVDKSGKKFTFERKLLGVAEIKAAPGASSKTFCGQNGHLCWEPLR